MASRSNQRRAERALAECRRRLQGLNAEEVRLMLDRRRVRSPERVAMARERLAELERGKQARPRAAAPPEAHPRGGSKPTPPVRPNGRDRADNDRVAEEERALASIVGGAGVRLSRQVGGVLGIGLGIAGIAALALLIARR